MALLLKGHSEHINVIVRQRRMDSRSPIGSGTGQAGMAFLVGACQRRPPEADSQRHINIIPFLPHVIALLFYVIARPSQGGRGNLSVPLRIYEYERLLRRPSTEGLLAKTYT